MSNAKEELVKELKSVDDGDEASFERFADIFLAREQAIRKQYENDKESCNFGSFSWEN